MYDNSPISWRRSLLWAWSTLAILTVRPATAAETSPGKGVDIPVLVRTIDQQMAAQWAESKVQPAARSGDAEYFRRVSLDLAGRIPTAAEVQAFLNDPAPDKPRVVDRLLNGPAYVENFTRFWYDLLVPEVGSDVILQLTSSELESWLRGQVAANVPHDRMLRSLVSLPMEADGQRTLRVFDRNRKPIPVAFYYAKEARPENIAAATARTFLGIRIECAECHDHPFARWKREEFWGLAAFFGGLDNLGNSESPGPLRDIFDRRELLIPGTEKVVPARFLGGGEPEWKPGVAARKTLSDWLTAADNPFFARATVNRYWAHFFGVGLIDPVDDMDEKTASHPEVLDSLAHAFADHGFDTQFLIRVITATRAYQLSSQGSSGATGPQLFGRMSTKALTPRQLFDSVARATGLENSTNPFRPLVDPNVKLAEFLRKFGRRDEAPTEAETPLLQALALMNGKLVHEVTDVERGAILGAVADAPFLDTTGKIEALFLATVSRPPHPEELARLVEYVKNGGPNGDRRQALGDVFWALLNSGEFLFNH